MSPSDKPALAQGTTAPMSKLDRLVALLKKPDGVDMLTMRTATGWQAHSVRGAMAGALRKKGHSVRSEQSDTGRVWRIVPAEPQA